MVDLTLVSGDAVFSTSAGETGLDGCVYKPPSRKSLKTKDHIAKVREGRGSRKALPQKRDG